MKNRTRLKKYILILSITSVSSENLLQIYRNTLIRQTSK